ncbi:hypothetical protein GGS24DRAFT_500212 [Hypoxylon argillaceum]|nr:hypothetical protein GGS24DRAFT_500212 [Hypoxylon argillaceum]KAI1152266.1 hypothetical protein F4825DRAFT_461991 [Nemania diffusa]
MPPRISSGTAPIRAKTKPRVKKSARSKETESTPAQEKREERERVIRRVQQCQALHRETPSQLEDNKFMVEATSTPHKRPAYPSYDDSSNKRGKIGQGPKAEKVACRAPWEKDPKLEKPFSLSNLPVGTSSRDQDTIDAMGKFAELPPEVRDEILRYILLWPYNIPVFHGWGRVFPRSRPFLDLSIMYTCRALRDQGLGILFGENKFEYNIRDPVAAHGHTNPVMEKVFGTCVVPINQHGHLIRHIKITIEPNRLDSCENRQNFENAILKFLPGGGLAHVANLHTITLEIPVVCNRHLKPPIKTMKADEVPICHHLHSGSRVNDALFQLRVQWVHVLALDKDGNCWETKLDMRNYVKDEQMRLEYMAHNNEIHPVDASCYRIKDLEVMQKLWDRRVKQAVGGLRNLVSRIQILAVMPEIAVQYKLWKKVTYEKGCRPNTGDGFQSLPQSGRDPSSVITTRSGRSRTIAARFDQNIGLSTDVPARSNININITIKPNPGHLNIFQSGDVAREAELLQAQHGTHENEREGDERGMLTEEWLENPPECDAKEMKDL